MSASSGRSSSPGCRAPEPRYCTACSARTRHIRACTCGWPSFRSRVRPATRGTQTRGTPLDAQFTRTIRRTPSTPACTSWPPTSWRSAGSCCGSRCIRCRTRRCRTYPAIRSWLSQQDWTPAYQRHRRNLQLIGLNDVEKRWVLKNPSHLFALDALMATYPDALVIQTHRPVETIMASMCSLAQHTADGLVDDVLRCRNRC